MRREPATKLLTYRWVIFGTMALAYVFAYFHRQSPAVVANDLQDTFQTSAGFVGLLASAYFYPYALMQFPAGLLSDSLGPRKSATIFLFVAAIGSILFGAAPNIHVAVFARVLVGLGVSLIFISTMKILSQWFRPREFSSMAAILNVTGGIGVLSAATPLALITGWIGWRYTFEAIGIATGITVILVWVIVRNRPEDLGWPSLAEVDHEGPGTATPPQEIPLWDGVRQVVSEPRFWAIVCWFFCFGGIYFAFAGLWAGPYFMHVYGMSRAEAGGVLNMVAVGLIVGSPIMSLLSERVFRSRKKVLIVAGSLLIWELVIMNIYCEWLPHWALYLGMFLFSVRSDNRIYNHQRALPSRDSRHIGWNGQSIPISRGCTYANIYGVDIRSVSKECCRRLSRRSVRKSTCCTTSVYLYRIRSHFFYERNLSQFGVNSIQSLAELKFIF